MAGIYDDWLLVERERLRELYLWGLARLTQLCKAQELFEEALSHARHLVAEDPLHEEGHREIMRLCHLLGRSEEALLEYSHCQDILDRELGVGPSAATFEMYREILSRAAEVQPAHLPQPAGPQPSPVLEGAGQVSLVGRQHERAILLDCLEQAMRGAAQLVLVEGEAGIGKTRLLQELARDAEWRGARMIWGHGRELTEPPPYGSLAEALRSSLSPLRASQLAQLVDPSWLGEACLVLPELAQWLPDLPLLTHTASESERSRLPEALTRLILALSDLGTLVFIVDDLQWVDQPTLQTLTHLARAIQERRQSVHCPLLLVGTFRSTEARERSPVWEELQAMDRAGRCQRLEMSPLSPSEAAELVRRSLGLTRQVPRFEERVCRETAGNPLFILETLRAWRDEGLLYRGETGEWSTPWDDTTLDYAELPLPKQVYQTISKRLGWLGPDEQETLRMAAVLGNECDLPLLLRTSGIEDKWALAAIGELVRRRLLEERPTGLQFSHPRVREVAYAEMAPSQRTHLHRQAAEAIEAQHPQRVEALAHHFTRGEQWDKALTYNRQAGDRARALYAAAQATGYYGHALEAWQRSPSAGERLGAMLHQARGEAWRDMGRFDQAEADFRAAAGLASAAGSQETQAGVLNSLSYLHLQRGDYDAAVGLARQALQLAQACASPQQTAHALLNKANALRNLARPQEAIRFYRQAAQMLEQQGDVVRLADCRNRLGYAFLFTGDFGAARQVMSEALAARRRLGDRAGLSYSLTNLTALCLMQGDLREAQELAQEALRVAQSAGDPYGEDAALFNIGLVTLEQGSPDQAFPFLEQSRAMASRIGDRPLEAETCAEIGRVHLLTGNPHQAGEALRHALDLMHRGGECWHEPKTRVYLVEASLALDDCEAALAHARCALQIAEEIGDRWSIGLAHRAMAQVAAATGNTGADACPSVHFEKSVEILRQIDARAELARSLAAYSRHLLHAPAAPQRQRAASLLQEARSLFVEIGMALDLARLDAPPSAPAAPAPVSVRLPCAAAPTGRPLREDEWVTVAWTVAAPEDTAITGKVARRRYRLLRLLRQATEQGAAPTVDDLAQALSASRATIKRDLAALRKAGRAVPTRGSRTV